MKLSASVSSLSKYYDMNTQPIEKPEWIDYVNHKFLA